MNTESKNFHNQSLTPFLIALCNQGLIKCRVSKTGIRILCLIPLAPVEVEGDIIPSAKVIKFKIDHADPNVLFVKEVSSNDLEGEMEADPLKNIEYKSHIFNDTFTKVFKAHFTDTPECFSLEEYDAAINAITVGSILEMTETNIIKLSPSKTAVRLYAGSDQHNYVVKVKEFITPADSPADLIQEISHSSNGKAWESLLEEQLLSASSQHLPHTINTMVLSNITITDGMH